MKMPIQTIMTISGVMQTHSRQVEFRHVMFDFIDQRSEEDALIQPQHVAGGENHADGGEHGPCEVGLRGALQDEDIRRRSCSASAVRCWRAW